MLKATRWAVDGQGQECPKKETFFRFPSLSPMGDTNR